MVRAAEGRLDLAVPIARECVDRAEATGASACVLASSWVLGDALHRLGKFAEARDDPQARRGRRARRRPARSGGRRSRRGSGPRPRRSARSAAAIWTRRSPRPARSATTWARPGILGKRAETAAGTRRHRRRRSPISRPRSRSSRQQGARPALARVLQSWGDALRARRPGRRGDAAPRAIGGAVRRARPRRARPARFGRRSALGDTKIAFD